MQPFLSKKYSENSSSAIRDAQILFSKRSDQTKAINLAIGNVTLPMHEKMKNALLNIENHPEFGNGIIKYTQTKGLPETIEALKRVMQFQNINTDNLNFQITDGGSQAMELAFLGIGNEENRSVKVFAIDPVYANYHAIAKRVGVEVVSLPRVLEDNAEYSLPEIDSIRELVVKEKPSAILLIPFDNPTGQIFPEEYLKELLKISVEFNMWIISDEAYRGLDFVGKAKSVWEFGNKDVNGIEGRRIGIESTSKVWNACGLRIGALITDNKIFSEKSIFEQTTNLCANSIGQYLISVAKDFSDKELEDWFEFLNNTYFNRINKFSSTIKALLPEIIITKPNSAIYSVIDVKNIAPINFSATEFVQWAASEGSVELENELYTVLVAPMSGFYADKNIAKTQMRISYVESDENLEKAAKILASLLKQYISSSR